MDVVTIDLPKLPNDLKYNVVKLQSIIKTLKSIGLNITKHLLVDCIEYKKKFNPKDYDLTELNSYNEALCYRFTEPTKSYLRGCFTLDVQNYIVLPKFDIFENVYFEATNYPKKFILVINTKAYEMNSVGNQLFSDNFFIPFYNIKNIFIAVIFVPKETYTCTFIGGYFNYIKPSNVIKTTIYSDGFKFTPNGNYSFTGTEYKNEYKQYK